MTTSIKEATDAAIEARMNAADAWNQAYSVMCKAYRDYLLADDLGLDQEVAAQRYLALRKIERKANRVWNKAMKICKFLGAAE